MKYIKLKLILFSCCVFFSMDNNENNQMYRSDINNISLKKDINEINELRNILNNNQEYYNKEPGQSLISITDNLKSQIRRVLKKHKVYLDKEDEKDFYNFTVPSSSLLLNRIVPGNKYGHNRVYINKVNINLINELLGFVHFNLTNLFNSINEQSNQNNTNNDSDIKNNTVIK